MAEKENVGMGMDEQYILNKYGLDSNKKRNSRQRASFDRRIRYLLNRDRVQQQFMQNYWKGFGWRNRN